MPNLRNYIRSFHFCISKYMFTFATVHCPFYCLICLFEQVCKLMFPWSCCQHIKLKHFVGSALRPQLSQGICSHKCVETQFLDPCALPRQALSSAGIKPLLIYQRKMQVPCNLNVLNLLWASEIPVVFNGSSFYLGLVSCQFNFVSEWRDFIHD